MSKYITVTSGNLFQIAAEYLGDATQWIRIAQLNGINDPFIRTLIILNLPTMDQTMGGGIVTD